VFQQVKFTQAPIKTQWGYGMVQTNIEIDKDHTASLYCEKECVKDLIDILNKTTFQEEN
jgi:hypothetical protein